MINFIQKDHESSINLEHTHEKKVLSNLLIVLREEKNKTATKEKR